MQATLEQALVQAILEQALVQATLEQALVLASRYLHPNGYRHFDVPLPNLEASLLPLF